jgi:hypothetical protein
MRLTLIHDDSYPLLFLWTFDDLSLADVHLTFSSKPSTPGIIDTWVPSLFYILDQFIDISPFFRQCTLTLR